MVDALIRDLQQTQQSDAANCDFRARIVTHLIIMSLLTALLQRLVSESVNEYGRDFYRKGLLMVPAIFTRYSWKNDCWTLNVNCDPADPASNAAYEIGVKLAGSRQGLNRIRQEWVARSS